MAWVIAQDLPSARLVLDGGWSPDARIDRTHVIMDHVTQYVIGLTDKKDRFASSVKLWKVMANVFSARQGDAAALSAKLLVHNKLGPGECTDITIAAQDVIRRMNEAGMTVLV
jgi:hypothetical protein